MPAKVLVSAKELAETKAAKSAAKKITNVKANLEEGTNQASELLNGEVSLEAAVKDVKKFVEGAVKLFATALTGTPAAGIPTSKIVNHVSSNLSQKLSQSVSNTVGNAKKFSPSPQFKP